MIAHDQIAIVVLVILQRIAVLHCCVRVVEGQGPAVPIPLIIDRAQPHVRQLQPMIVVQLVEDAIDLRINLGIGDAELKVNCPVAL